MLRLSSAHMKFDISCSSAACRPHTLDVNEKNVARMNLAWMNETMVSYASEATYGLA